MSQEFIAYVYMMQVIDRDGDISFYTGYTTRLQQRVYEHMTNQSKYMRYYHHDSIKKLIYVERVKPKFKQQKYHQREWKIKRMSYVKKEELVRSSSNRLRSFNPNFGHPIIKLK